MLIPSIRQTLQSLFNSSRSGRRRQRRSRLSTQHTALYRVEQLEDRTMLSAGSIVPFVDLSVTQNFADSNFYERTYEFAIQADGKMVVSGYRVKNAAWETELLVARYNTDGSVDNSFNGVGSNTFPNSTNANVSIGLQSDGKIIVFGHLQGQEILVARYNVDGTLDTSYSQTPFTHFAGIKNGVVLPDDKILISIQFQESSGDKTSAALTRLNSDLTLDTSFGSGGTVTYSFLGLSGSPKNTNMWTMAMQSDGKILLAGSTGPDNHIVRFNADGTVDPSYMEGSIGPKGAFWG